MWMIWDPSWPPSVWKQHPLYFSSILLILTPSCSCEVGRPLASTVPCWWLPLLTQPLGCTLPSFGIQNTIFWFSFFLDDHTGIVWAEKEPAKVLEIVWQMIWKKTKRGWCHTNQDKKEVHFFKCWRKKWNSTQLAIRRSTKLGQE